jgi:hypothetical protein
MSRLGMLLGVSALLSACCHAPRFPNNLRSGGAGITRDEYVEEWRVNGEKVCRNVFAAAQGCYVLEVTYSAKMTIASDRALHDALFGRERKPSDPRGVSYKKEPEVRDTTYRSNAAPFALAVRDGHQYFVSATFTGDEFLPHIVEYDPTGKKLREIVPAETAAELDSCRRASPSEP